MPKGPSSREIFRMLEAYGFIFKSQRGSHVKYVKENKTVMIPHPRKEMPYGTYLSILEQAGLTKDEAKN